MSWATHIHIHVNSCLYTWVWFWWAQVKSLLKPMELVAHVDSKHRFVPLTVQKGWGRWGNSVRLVEHRIWFGKVVWEHWELSFHVLAMALKSEVKQHLCRLFWSTFLHFPPLCISVHLWLTLPTIPLHSCLACQPKALRSLSSLTVLCQNIQYSF